MVGTGSERREVAVIAEGLWIETQRPPRIPSVLRVKKTPEYRFMAIPWFLGRTNFRVIFNRPEWSRIFFNAILLPSYRFSI